MPEMPRAASVGSEATEGVLARVEIMLAGAGPDAAQGRDEARGMAAVANEPVPVRVSLTIGRGSEARALLIPPSGNKHWFPAELVAEQLGVDAEALPGMRFLAVVADGELVSFRLSERGELDPQ